MHKSLFLLDSGRRDKIQQFFRHLAALSSCSHERAHAMALSLVAALFVHEEVTLPSIDRTPSSLAGNSGHEFGSRTAHRLISDEWTHGHNFLVSQPLAHTLQGQDGTDAGHRIAGADDNGVFLFQQIQESLAGEGGIQTRKKKG
jgi:hypothetical protein